MRITRAISVYNRLLNAHIGAVSAHISSITEIVAVVVKQAIKREDTHKFVLSRPQTILVEKKDQEQFVRLVETEIYSLHEGNFARYRITQSEFSQWYDNWNSSLSDQA